MRHHLFCDCLGDEEGAPQIRVENEVPVVPRHVNGPFPHVAAGVVDENVEA
jgi:hypothetical protein